MGSTKLFGVRQVVNMDFGDSPLGELGDRTARSGDVSIPSEFDTSYFLSIASSKNILSDRVSFIRELSKFFSQFSSVLGNLFGACFPDDAGDYSDELILHYLTNARGIFSPFKVEGVSSAEVISQRCFVHWRKLSLRDLLLVGAGLYRVKLKLFEWQLKQDNLPLMVFYRHIFNSWIDFFYQFYSFIEESKSKNDEWEALLGKLPISSLVILLDATNRFSGKNDEKSKFFSNVHRFLLLSSIEIVKNSTSSLGIEYQKITDVASLHDLIIRTDSKVRHVCDDLIPDKITHDTVVAIVFFDIFISLPEDSAIKEHFLEVIPVSALGKMLFLANHNAYYSLSDRDLILENLVATIFSGIYPKFLFYCDKEFWVSLSKQLKSFDFKCFISDRKDNFTAGIIDSCDKGFSSIINADTLTIDSYFFTKLSAVYYYNNIISMIYGKDFPDSIRKKKEQLLYHIDTLSAEMKFYQSVGVSDLRVMGLMCNDIGADFLLRALDREIKYRNDLINDHIFHRRACELFDKFLSLLIFHFDRDKVNKLDTEMILKDFDNIFVNTMGTNSPHEFIKKIFFLLFLERLDDKIRQDVISGSDLDVLNWKRSFRGVKYLPNGLDGFFSIMIVLCGDLINYDKINEETLSFWNYFNNRVLSISVRISANTEILFNDSYKKISKYLSVLNLIFNGNADDESFKECMDTVKSCCQVIDEVEKYSFRTGNALPDFICDEINKLRSGSFVVNPEFFSNMPLNILVELIIDSKKYSISFILEQSLGEIYRRQRVLFDESNSTIGNAIRFLSQNRVLEFVKLSVMVMDILKRSYSFYSLVSKIISSDTNIGFKEFVTKFVSDNFHKKDDVHMKNAAVVFYGEDFYDIRSLVRKVYLDTKEEKRGSPSMQKIYFVFFVFWKTIDDLMVDQGFVQETDMSEMKFFYDDVKFDHVYLFSNCFDFDLRKHCRNFFDMHRRELERKKRDIC
ncbi:MULTISPECIES: hypothetical protein [Candidatus Ichthyocystis]|uniref:Uncharacterized protein n=1 Tax=Candidatus Ichthyocystis hellenicum TaxID=1561003 RepID=A0A0S4M491_9BURK|nr:MULTISPECIES: hypothetical protein [Ichthyocystis]CUT17530.1 hypothetical protein Ark11_0695 [Candidatus Ichthyocystis hellenicum]